MIKKVGQYLGAGPQIIEITTQKGLTILIYAINAGGINLHDTNLVVSNRQLQRRDGNSLMLSMRAVNKILKLAKEINETEGINGQYRFWKFSQI